MISTYEIETDIILMQCFFSAFFSFITHMGAHRQVDRALDSRLEGLGLSPKCWSCVEVCWANFVFHTASVHPAIMGTWCTDPSWINSCRLH